MKFISLSILLASYVAGQCNNSITINSQGDATSLSSCSTFTGDITANAISVDSLDFSGITQVKGSITISNSFNLKNINFPSLKSVSGSFTLLNNTQVISLNTAQLSSCGNFIISNNPNLRTLTVNSISTVGGFSIINTSVDSISGLSFKNATYIDVSANSYLNKIDFSNLTNINGFINIADNDSGSTANFPNLISIGGNSTFRGLSSLNVSNVTTLSDTFNLNGNSFTSFSLDKLSNVSKDITIFSNPQLSSFKIPLLTSIDGGIQIRQNNLLLSIDQDAFPNLATVKGGVDINGTMTNITFPKLTRIDGAFVLSTSGSADCAQIKKTLTGVYRGTFSCTAKTASSSGGSSSASGSSAAPRSASFNSKLAGSIVAIALIAATFF
ncbi:Protein ecm33 [Smittium culicis]|uniref:Protein ecm33 n=2 Tax=Smittium culicis TaxID=133412 RepID=A0A1R1X7W2_9FUNG|nr:Protein ecm33 [Smittium culicis]